MYSGSYLQLQISLQSSFPLSKDYVVLLWLLAQLPYSPYFLPSFSGILKIEK